jgi:uncharacterized protein (TIGR03382 family)
MGSGKLASFCAVVAFAGGAVACVAPARERAEPQIAIAGDSPIVESIDRVSRDTGVPAPLLAAIAHSQTRFRVPTGHAHGRTSVGILGLPEAELLRGARLAGVGDAAARTEIEAGLRAGAALLRDAAPTAVTLDDYLAVLEPGLRRAVDRALARGVDARDPSGHAILLAARPEVGGGFGSITQGAGYPGAVWAPAYAGNYDEANRDVGDITNVVIHTTQGSFDGTISWFQDPSANVSAHYVVRSEDGFVTQMVSEKNIAWHDKCFNTRTVGIEHEGFVEDPELWYTEPMYLESAKLVAYLCDKYGIAKEFGAIVGHDTAPDCSTHTDPGAGWNWEHFIDLVKTGGAQFGATDVVVDAPPTLISGDRGTVRITVTNTGNTVWELDVTRLGTAQPQDRESELFVDGDWLGTNRPTGVDGRVMPGETGTFTFEVVAPEVVEPTVFDETFQVVEEGVVWFGPDIHVQIQVMPRVGDAGGCSTTGGGAGFACMFAAGALVLVPRRRRRRA